MATFKPILFAVLLTFLVAMSSALPKPKKFNLEFPEECKGKTICNIKPKGYDEMQEYIESLLNTTFVAQTMADRNGEGEEKSSGNDSNNCPYVEETEASPYAYIDSVDLKPYYIIQNRVLSQPIKMVKCAYSKINVTASEQCFANLGLSTFKMKSSCVESSAERTLIVYDETKGYKKKPYSFSCCCSCRVDKV